MKSRLCNLPKTAIEPKIIAEHLCQIALELGLSKESIREDWLQKTIQFVERAYQELSYKCFVAEIEGNIVGSASCQILELYPMLSEAYQKGYIWGVYDDSAHRRKGIATKLMNRAASYLQMIGCTQVVLHASDLGKELYFSLGYRESNEMVLHLHDTDYSAL